MLGLFVFALIAIGVLHAWANREGPTPLPETLEGRALEVFEEEQGSDTFYILGVDDPALPDALVVEPPPQPGALERAFQRVLGPDPPVEPTPTTGDRRFDAQVVLSGLPDADLAALFDTESRWRVAAVVGEGCRLRSGRWKSARQRSRRQLQPLAQPLVNASVHLAGRWARVSADREAVLLEQLMKDASPGHRQTCLRHLLDTAGEARRAAIEFARTEDDINLRAPAAALDGAAGLPVLLEAVEDAHDPTTRTRIEACRAVHALADDATRAALVRRMLHRSPAETEADLLDVLLAGDPGGALPPIDVFGPWFSPDTSEAAQREHLARWFGGFGAEGRACVQALLAHERDRAVICAAVDALARVGLPADIRDLEGMRPGLLDISVAGAALRAAVDDAIGSIRARQTGEAGALSLSDDPTVADGRLSLEHDVPDARLSLVEDGSAG